MENVNKKITTITEDFNQKNNDDFNKVEWINYFNEDLIVESISNQINNSKNENKTIASYDKNDKNSNINNTYINISKATNSSNYKNIEIIKQKELQSNNELYANKNYYFSNIKELYGPKNILSFEYQEKITIDNLSNKLNLFKENNYKNENNEEEDFKNKKYKNVIVINNENEKEKSNDKKNNNEIKLKNKNNKKNNINKNKSVDTKDENYNKKKKNKNKEINNNKNKGNLSDRNYNLKNNSQDKNNEKDNLKKMQQYNFRRYEPQSSYALRYKKGKNYKLNGHFHPNEEKPVFIDKKIALGRTLPEMIVLNNYGLVNDDDYIMYQKIVNYNKLHNKRNKKNDLKSYYMNNSGNNVNDINNTIVGKSNLNLNSNDNNEIKIQDENIKTSFI